MKKYFVFGFLSALFLACFAGLLVSFVSTKMAPRYESASVERNIRNFADPSSPSAMPVEAPPPEAMARREEGKMGKKDMFAPKGGDSGGFGGLGLRGAGPGGGGMGSGASLGSIGAHAVAAPKPMKIVMKKPAPAADEEQAEGGEGQSGPAATRAWFPETFLFEPLIVTNEQGLATVPVKVPDRLTSWRVLALAHSRQGGQAGAVTAFLGTLPTYVDPVIPGFLVAGDEVRLPVQLVNTTAAEIKTTLKLSSANATLSAAGGAVKVPAEGNTVQYVVLSAPRPGTVGFKAVLGDTDAVERTIEVKPAGKLQATSAGSTLAAPRSVELSGPADALEGSERIRLQVYPGALALVRSELTSAPGRGGVADDAYTLLLTGRAPSLLQSLGGEPALDAIRDLSVVSTQRAIRHARSPDVPSAVLLAEAAFAHAENPVLGRLGERLANQVAAAQRPDGTCQGADGWTLQRLLVTTAGCVQAVRSAQGTPAQKQRASAVAIRAQGAFERNLARIDDGFTAAAILASGSVSGTIADTLKDKVLKAITNGTDGAKLLPVDNGVVRADGNRPSVAEATALAVLALQGDEKQAAVVADLGTWLLSNYSPVYGWGDGQANLAALRAVTLIFKSPVPPDVKISLERDGQPIVSGVLDAAHLHDVLTLEALTPGSKGNHTWGVKADPAVPGLGFSLTLMAHRPWKDELASGLEYTAKLPAKLEVGKPGELELTVAAPANTETKLKLALPAGVQADTPSLDALVDAHTIIRFDTEDGAITLHFPPSNAGATVSLKLKVVPTLAGTLHPAATTFEPEGRPQLVSSFKPAVWVVK
jgi:hypothetical protein